MKTFYALAAVVLIASVQAGENLTDEQKIRAETYNKECIAETGADVDLVKKLHAGEFPDDAKLKCFAKCFFEKAGIFKDGKFQTTILIQELVKAGGEEEAITKGVLECDSQKSEDDCESSYVLWQCGKDKKIF